MKTALAPAPAAATVRQPCAPPQLAAVAVVCALVGGAAALTARKADRLGRPAFDDDRLPRLAAAARQHRGAGRRGPEAKPLAGNGFDPRRIYAARAPGVVTIFSEFGSDPASATVAQGSGFVVSPQGYVLTNSHVITQRRRGVEPSTAADRVYVEFQDRDRVAAKVVGWDVFDDVGLLKVDPSEHALDSRPARQLGRHRRRRAGGGDRKPVRQRGLARRRRRLGDPPLDRLADFQFSPRRRDPDRRSDQPRQLGRAAVRRARPRDRDQRSDPQRLRQRRGRRASPCPINSARRSMQQLVASGAVSYAFVGVVTSDLTPAARAPLRLRRPAGRRPDEDQAEFARRRRAPARRLASRLVPRRRLPEGLGRDRRDRRPAGHELRGRCADRHRSSLTRAARPLHDRPRRQAPRSTRCPDLPLIEAVDRKPMECRAEPGGRGAGVGAKR